MRCGVARLAPFLPSLGGAVPAAGTGRRHHGEQSSGQVGSVRRSRSVRAGFGRYAARPRCPAAAGPSSSGPLAQQHLRRAAGSGTGVADRLTTQAKPAPRRKASTPAGAASQVIVPSPRPARPGAAPDRRAGRAPASSAGRRSARSAVRSLQLGRLRQPGLPAAPSGLNPNGGASPDHGSGTRQPSRPGFDAAGPGQHRVLAQLVRDVLDLAEAEFLALVDVGRSRAAPGCSSAAARARRVPSSRSVSRSGPGGGRRSRLNEVSARPYRVTCRVTSWLDSTQVAGAPTGACAASVASMLARSADGVPGAAEEVEVERGVQLVRAQVVGEPLPVGQPDLADQGPRSGVRVGDRAARPGRCRAPRRGR